MVMNSEYENQKVLITGGAGLIGSNLTRVLSELGANITILDNLSAGYKWNIPKADNINFIEGDVLDDKALKRAFKEKPEYIYHLSANFANQNSVDNPEKDLMVNGIGTLKVLEYCQLVDPQRVVYASSGCGCYGLDSKIPFTEPDISINLHTPYQVTKLLGELYTNYFHNQYNLPIVNARFFNVYGPGEVPGRYRNVIPNFFYWAMNGKPLPITGDGTETRDWTYVEDIVQGLLLMGKCEKAIGEAINLGSGVDHTVLEMAGIINDLTDNSEVGGIDFIPRREWDAKTKLLSSIDKAKKILGYKPAVSFEEGLRKTYEWFETCETEIWESAEF
jgi:nucleoside-diphosphate-sugar epimerase